MPTRQSFAAGGTFPGRRGKVRGAIVGGVLVLAGFIPVAGQTPVADRASPVAGGATPVAADFPNPAPQPLAWTQLGPDGVLIARALATDDCPAITIDGVETALAVRAGPADAFPGAVCEGAIPPGADAAEIAGEPLALLPDRIERIAVVGDTGCRIAAGGWYQACNDPGAWPLARVADQIAASKPDLVIHVGDYVYREAPCPAGEAACAGSPWGDNAATWQADLFGPMAPALRAAPWVFVRGNHENCDREGNGWFRYLDPRPLPASCTRFTDPYAVPVGDLRFTVMDTAEAADVTSTPELDAAFSARLDRLAALTQPGDWLLTHKPVAGGILKLDEDRSVAASARETAVFNATFSAVADNRLPAGIDVVLSGHIHLLQAILSDAAAGRPVQIVAGNGGTLLDPGTTGAYTGAFLGDASIDVGLVGAGVGWMTMEIAGDRVLATASAIDGGAFFTLLLPAPR